MINYNILLTYNNIKPLDSFRASELHDLNKRITGFVGLNGPPVRKDYANFLAPRFLIVIVPGVFRQRN